MARGFERLMENQAARDELLSAYLDDQLDAEDRARLEVQLAADPALRSELEMLRRAVALVRDLSPQPIPRNFILPQETTPQVRPALVARRPRWLAPFLTAATAAVSLLFVAVLARDLLFFGVGGMTQLAAPAPAADEAVVGSAPVEKAIEEEGASQTFTVTESPEENAADGTRAVAEAPLEPDEAEGTPPPEAATPPTTPGGAYEADGGEEGAEPTLVSERSPLPPAGGGEPPVESPAPTPTPAAVEAADLATQSDTPEAEKSAPVPPPEPAAAEPTEWALRDTEPAPDAVGETEPPPSDRGDADILSHVSPWRVAEVALGVSALLLLVAAFWAWRARRR